MRIEVCIFQSTLPIQGEANNGVRTGYRVIFQSTLPIQGEAMSLQHACNLDYISIHSPYTGRGHHVPSSHVIGQISIHSPYTGRGISIRQSFIPFRYFNPLSLYRERRIMPIYMLSPVISIHSPYTGRGSNFAHKTPNIQPISYAKRQTKELFPTPTQQIITSLALISSISRCESPCIFMCTSHSH